MSDHGRLVLVCRAVLACVATLFPIVEPTFAKAPPLEARSVLLKLIDQVDVPARQAGILANVEVREGDRVESGQLLAGLEDDDAQLARQQAELELEIARIKAQDESPIRSAEQSLTLARAELARARESIKRFANSISQSELDRMQLAEVEAQTRLAHLQSELGIARATYQLRQKQLDGATLQVEKRRIVSPIDGMVAEVYRRRGEWVEEGDRVLRIVRLDMLRAEGFLELRHLRPELLGAEVSIDVTLPDGRMVKKNGKITFIHPEIDPVNQQVRVWADVENDDWSLQPGMAAQMRVQLPLAASTPRQ